MKKIISIFLCVVLLLGVLPSGVFSVGGLTSGDYTYTVSNGKATITECDKSVSGDITIPSTLGGYPVTAIGDNAFYWRTSLTSVRIPNSVTTIGNSAFSNCSSLTNVTIPDSVTTIGKQAFSNCTLLTNVTIPNCVTTIGYSAFDHCTSLTSITIPNSVTTIGDYSFYWCTSLNSITIPDSVATIGEEAFYYTAYYNNRFNWENNVLYIGNHLIRAKTSKYGNYEIKFGTKTIADNAFYDCTSLTNVRIPDSVTTIGAKAFSYCFLLTSITIPNSVTTIGERVFTHCISLTSVTIPDSVTSIGYEAFSYCKLLISITIPNSVTTIGEDAFSDCFKLTDVYYNGLKKDAQKISIGSNNSYLTNATWHYEKEKISEEYLTYKVTNGEATITGCNQSVSGDVAIPSTLGGYPVTAIADYAFYGCNLLTNIELPEGITTIGSGAFNSCSALVSVIIPESVTSIGLGAFSWCNSLESIEVSENSDYFVSEDGILFNKDKTTIICYPASKTETTYTVPESVTTIGSRAFLGCTYLVSITIPNSVTSIGNDAFYSCSSLKDVYYNGCKAKADKISKGSGNTALTNAVWHYEPNTDFDGDNVTDKKDYQYIADVYTGKIKVQKKAEIYDMNGDGEFDIRDIVAIKEIINA